MCGVTRTERHGARVAPACVCAIVTPASLVARIPLGGNIRSIDRAACALRDDAHDAGLALGFAGSYGFELATGTVVTHAASDLDAIVGATDRTTFRRFAIAYDAIETLTGGHDDPRQDRYRSRARAVSAVASLARAPTTALLDELATTPKPGLVDLEHRGAHRDLCLDRLRTSAHALEPFFAEIAACARDASPSLALREEIGNLGRLGERAMLRASGGPNTHRGAL